MTKRLYEEFPKVPRKLKELEQIQDCRDDIRALLLDIRDLERYGGLEERELVDRLDHSLRPAAELLKDEREFRFGVKWARAHFSKRPVVAKKVVQALRIYQELISAVDRLALRHEAGNESLDRLKNGHLEPCRNFLFDKAADIEFDLIGMREVPEEELIALNGVIRDLDPEWQTLRRCPGCDAIYDPNFWWFYQPTDMPADTNCK